MARRFIPTSINRTYGRPPVGKGHDAAGFKAVFAPGAAAVEGATAGVTAGLPAATFLTTFFLQVLPLSWLEPVWRQLSSLQLV